MADKEETEFYKCKQNKDGLMPYCKLCDNNRKTELLRRKSEALGKTKLNTLDSRELKSQGLKHCPKCKVAKPFADFGLNKASYDGLASHCIICIREITNTRNANPVVKEKKQAKYKRDKSKVRDSRLKMKFGISLEEYNNKLKEQNGICPGCGMTPEQNGKDFAVDHNHETGMVRGLLCSRCNAGLGFLQDNINICNNIIRYIERWN